jgi:hypothetical protein
MRQVAVRKKPSESTSHRKKSLPLESDRNYSVPDGARAAGVATITFWRAIYAGHLQTFRIGRRRIVSGSQILEWLKAGGKTGHSKPPTAAELGEVA